MSIYIRDLWHKSAALPIMRRGYLGSGLDPTSLVPRYVEFRCSVVTDVARRDDVRPSQQVPIVYQCIFAGLTPRRQNY